MYELKESTNEIISKIVSFYNEKKKSQFGQDVLN